MVELNPRQVSGVTTDVRDQERCRQQPGAPFDEVVVPVEIVADSLDRHRKVAGMRTLKPLFAFVAVAAALSVPSGSLAGVSVNPNNHDFLFGVEGGLRYAVDPVPWSSDNGGFASSEAGCGDQTWHLIGGG